MTAVNRNQPQAHHHTSQTQGGPKNGARQGDTDLFQQYLRQTMKCCDDLMERLDYINERQERGDGQGQGDSQQQGDGQGQGDGQQQGDELPFASHNGWWTTKPNFHGSTRSTSPASGTTDAFGEYISSLLEEYRKSLQNQNENETPHHCHQPPMPVPDTVPYKDEHELIKDFAKELAKDLAKELKKELPADHQGDKTPSKHPKHPKDTAPHKDKTPSKPSKDATHPKHKPDTPAPSKDKPPVGGAPRTPVPPSHQQPGGQSSSVPTRTGIAALDRWDAQFAAASRSTGLPANFLKAVAWAESRGKSSASSHNPDGKHDDLGVMQISDYTYSDVLKHQPKAPRGLHASNPADNIMMGAWELRDKFGREGKNTSYEKTLAAYRGVEDGKDMSYAKVVMAFWNDMNHGKKPKD